MIDSRSLRSRRQHKAWGEAKRNPRIESSHKSPAREAGGSRLVKVELIVSDSISLTLVWRAHVSISQGLPPAPRAVIVSHSTSWGCASLHPRLYDRGRERRVISH